MAELLLLALAGAAVGTVQAVAGAGGGILGVPLLVALMHWTVAQAAPVALVGVSLSAWLAALLAWRAGHLRYRAAGFMGGLGMLVAPLGLAAAQRMAPKLLLTLFMALMAWTTWNALRGALKPAVPDARQAPPAPPCRRQADGRFRWTGPCAACLGAIGAAAGFLGGLLGVGGGFIIMPALTRASDVDFRTAQATTLAVIALVSTGAAVAAGSQGLLQARHALPFVGGAVAASMLGSRVAGRWPARRLKLAFAAVCLLAMAMLLPRWMAT